MDQVLKKRCTGLEKMTLRSSFLLKSISGIFLGLVFILYIEYMLNYDPKKDQINPKRCQICVQRLEEKKSDVIFPNP